MEHKQLGSGHYRPILCQKHSYSTGLNHYKGDFWSNFFFHTDSSTWLEKTIIITVWFEKNGPGAFANRNNIEVAALC